MSNAMLQALRSFGFLVIGSLSLATFFHPLAGHGQGPELIRKKDDRKGFLIITHPDNRVTHVSRRFLTQAFLKKTLYWPGGDLIFPVDLDPRSDVRRRFSESVLRRSIFDVKNYWQRQIFTGNDVPPPELNSDQEVIRYILRDVGAIGYVSEKADIEQVKVLKLD